MVTPIGIPDDRNHQPVRRVHGDAQMDIVLENQCLAVGRQRCVETGKRAQGLRQRLCMEGEGGQLDTARSGLVLKRGTELLHFAHVGAVVMGNRGDQRLGGCEIARRDLREP